MKQQDLDNKLINKLAREKTEYNGKLKVPFGEHKTVHIPISFLACIICAMDVLSIWKKPISHSITCKQITLVCVLVMVVNIPISFLKMLSTYFLTIYYLCWLFLVVIVRAPIQCVLHFRFSSGLWWAPLRNCNFMLRLENLLWKNIFNLPEAIAGIDSLHCLSYKYEEKFLLNSISFNR